MNKIVHGLGLGWWPPRHILSRTKLRRPLNTVVGSTSETSIVGWVAVTDCVQDFWDSFLEGAILGHGVRRNVVADSFLLREEREGSYSMYCKTTNTPWISGTWTLTVVTYCATTCFVFAAKFIGRHRATHAPEFILPIYDAADGTRQTYIEYLLTCCRRADSLSFIPKAILGVVSVVCQVWCNCARGRLVARSSNTWTLYTIRLRSLKRLP